MVDEVERTCATCRAWMPRDIGTLEPGQARDSGMGECRRSAPMLVTFQLRDAGGGHSMQDTDPDFDLTTTRNHTAFPVTLSIDWCRKWRVDHHAARLARVIEQGAGIGAGPCRS